MRIAAVQMTSTPERSRNLRAAHDLLLEALERKPQIVAFPENFSLLAEHSQEFVDQAETLKGMTVQILQEWAAEYEVYLLAGSLPLKAKGKPGKITNSSLFIAPNGEILAQYDKIHLFDADLTGDRAYQESKFVIPGKLPVIADTELGKFGMSICYDLRFPELYRAYAAEEVAVLFVPSAFTAVTGRAHWDVLTRARAIENQAYVIAPAQTGEPYPGRKTHGHTRIVDPWGRILAERPAGPGVVWAELRNEDLNRVRRDMPVLEHRRLK